MKLAHAVGVVALGVLLVGCSGQSDGAVAGTVRGFGGPARSDGSGGAFTGQPLPNAAVTFFDLSGGRSTAMADSDGRYTITLPPGTYNMVCAGVDKPPAGLALTSIEVTAGSTANADCDIQMP